MKKIIFLLLVCVFASCAKGKKPPTHSKPPVDSRSTPVGASDGEDTAERMASEAIVDDGQRALQHGLYDNAADLFQQAVTVDPTNGEAYYYLALARVRSGEYGEAEGLIEKADQLLGAKPDWVLKLEELKREFHQKSSGR